MYKSIMKLKFFAFFVLSVLIFTVSCKKETQLEQDKDAIKEYLRDNGIQAETTQNVYYVVLKEGTGAKCNAGDDVAYKYKVSTMSHPDVIVDQTEKMAVTCKLPLVVPNSQLKETMGLQVALTTMREGGKSRFYVPASLGYGDAEFGGETNAHLVYEVELCEILSNGNKH